MAEKQRFEIPPFIGGLNDTANQTEVADTEATIAKNVRFDETGAVSKRNGYTTYGNDVGSHKCLGLWEYRPSAGSGSNKQIAVFDGASNSDAYIHSGGTWTAQSQSLTAAKTAHFITFDDEAILANGAEFKTYDGTNWANVGGSPPSNPQLIEHWQNRVFAWDTDTNNPNRLFWSAAGNVDSWDTTNDNLDIPTANDGDFPMAIVADGQERLLLFKERSIHALYSVATGSATRRSISEVVGGVSQRSVIRVPNGVVFLSRGEKTPTVYFLSGNRLVDISSRKIGTGLAGLNHAQLSQACGTYYDNRVYISVPSSGTAHPDTTYVLDLNLTTLENPVWSKDSGYSPSVYAFFESSNEFIPHFGEAQSDGRVYRFDTGSNDNPSGTETAISAEYRTKYFDFGTTIRFRRLDLTVEAQSSSTKLDVYTALDYATTGSLERIDITAEGSLWGTMIWGSGKWGGDNIIQGTIDTNGRGRYIRFSFQNATAGRTFKIYPGLVLYWHPRSAK